MSKRKQSQDATGRAAGKRPALEEEDDELDALKGDDVDGLGLPLPFDELAGADDLGGDDLGGDAELAAALASEGGDPYAYAESEDGQSEAPDDDADVELPLDQPILEESEEVDFSKVEMSPAQARLAAPFLASNTRLVQIKFSGHELKISDLKEEDELEWDSEDYTDVEAIVIAELLKGNTTVKRLDLARNLISDDGAIALASMLRENTTLEYLNLEGCDVAEKGVQAFCNALPGNKTIQYLNLKENSMTSAGQQDLREVWTSSRSTVGLHL